jgi:hypothetical protein
MFVHLGHCPFSTYYRTGPTSSTSRFSLLSSARSHPSTTAAAIIRTVWLPYCRSTRRFQARAFLGMHVLGMFPPLSLFSHLDMYLCWRLNQLPRPVLSSFVGSLQTWSQQTVRRLKRALRLRSHYCPTSSRY